MIIVVTELLIMSPLVYSPNDYLVHVASFRVGEFI